MVQRCPPPSTDLLTRMEDIADVGVNHLVDVPLADGLEL
jgi:hypothetical protein